MAFYVKGIQISQDLFSHYKNGTFYLKNGTSFKCPSIDSEDIPFVGVTNDGRTLFSHFNNLEINGNIKAGTNNSYQVQYSTNVSFSLAHPGRIAIVDSSNVNVQGSAENDEIYTKGSDLISINGGNGDDNIEVIDGRKVSIDGGKGIDKITLSKVTRGTIYNHEDHDVVSSDPGHIVTKVPKK